jgi:hypothetical protein
MLSLLRGVVATIIKSRSRVADPYSAQLPDSDNPQTTFDVRIIVVSHAQLLIQTLEQMNDCRRLHLQKSFGERLLAETTLDAVVRRPHRDKTDHRPCTEYGRWRPLELAAKRQETGGYPHRRIPPS